MYTEPAQLVPLLHEALQTPPTPMSPMEQYQLSWDAASERLLDAAALPKGTPRTRDSAGATLAYYAHWAMGVQPVFDMFRYVTGAPPVQTLEERLAHSSRVLTLQGKRTQRTLKRVAASARQYGADPSDPPSQ